MPMEIKEKKTLAVTVDKRHIVSIGERLYTESVSICLDFFGPEGPECFSEGNVVYINRDHPLFLRESRKIAAETMYIARLVTQEISLMKETRSPRVAFNRQSELLKAAFAEE